MPPILVTPFFELDQEWKASVGTKGFTSSLLRSLFSGSIVVFRNHEMPLFKVERKQLEEIFVPTVIFEKSEAPCQKATREFLFGLCAHLEPESRQWVIVADAASLALRNIDHLIPQDMAGPYAPPDVDMLWTKTDRNDAENGTETASPGIWAVRGEHLAMVLERWKEAWIEAQSDSCHSEIEIWTRVIRDLPLRKRPFEKGEVVAPALHSVDWQAVSSAALVTVPDWPVEEQRKFLQSLYLGTYLGDESGMMLNIMEA
jgi:hypothetical protein